MCAKVWHFTQGVCKSVAFHPRCVQKCGISPKVCAKVWHFTQGVCKSVAFHPRCVQKCGISPKVCAKVWHFTQGVCKSVAFHPRCVQKCGIFYQSSQYSKKTQRAFRICLNSDIQHSQEFMACLPVAPVLPACPSRPAEPWDPVAPVVPGKPLLPLTPVDPVLPATPGGRQMYQDSVFLSFVHCMTCLNNSDMQYYLGLQLHTFCISKICEATDILTVVGWN